MGVRIPGMDGIPGIRDKGMVRDSPAPRRLRRVLLPVQGRWNRVHARRDTLLRRTDGNMVMTWAEEALAKRERFISGLSPWLAKHWDEAEFEAMQPYYETPRTWRLDIGGFETAEIGTELRCTHWDEGPGIRGRSSKREYIRCHRGAG